MKKITENLTLVSVLAWIRPDDLLNTSEKRPLVSQFAGIVTTNLLNGGRPIVGETPRFVLTLQAIRKFAIKEP